MKKPKIKKVSDEERKRAWNAVKEFRKLAVGLNTYARAVTGNKNVKVVATDGQTETDGRTIWVQPPIELGDMTPHDRAVCNKRGIDKRQLCKACDIREMALAAVFHEIAHIVFGSRVPPLPEGTGAIRAIVNEWHPENACGHAKEIFDSWQPNYMYLDYAATFHVILTMMINALEDARVNAAQFRARPGTRVMMEINLRQIFDDGVGELNLWSEAIDDDQLKWQDRPLSHQLLIGVFLEASEYYDITDELDPRVGRILRDPRMAEALSRIASAEDAHKLVVSACDVFRQLVDVGVLDVPKCVPPEPIPPMPPMPGSGGEQSDESDEPNEPNEPDEDTGGEFGKSEQGKARSKEQAKDQPEGQQDDTGTGQPGSSTTGKSNIGGDSKPGNDESQDEESADGDESGEEVGSDSGSEGSEGEGNDDGVPGENGTGEGSDSIEAGSGEDYPGQADSPGAGQEDSGGEPDSATEATASKPSDEGEDSQNADPAESNVRSEDDFSRDMPREDLHPRSSDNDADGGPDESDHKDELQEGVDGQESSPSDEDSERDGSDSGPDGAEDEVRSDSGQDGSAEPDGTDAQSREESEPEVDDEDSDYRPTEQDGETEYDSALVPTGDDGDAPISAISAEEVADALKAIALHNIIGPREDFATGENEVCVGHSNIDPAHNHFGLPDELIEAIKIAINQAGFFDTSSKNVESVLIVEHGDRKRKWYTQGHWEHDIFKPSEGAISKSVHEARVLFDANARGRRQGNLKAGKVDGRNLAKRVPQQDPRMFKKNILPKRESYEVFITADISGSTMSEDRISRIKRAVYGQAEMLHRVGVPFELWAHTSNWSNPQESLEIMDLWMYHIKKSGDPWNLAAKKRLSDLRPVAGNLDGHTLEFIRKRAQLSRATKKIICYYTDGAMPASNYYEELEVLQREIAICKKLDIALLAVGIDTDSPEEYGFRTCQVNSDADLPKVVKMLKEQMTV